MKKIIFYDKDNNLCYAIINMSHSIIIIRSYNILDKETAFLKLLVNKKKIYLDVLLCYERYRNKGVVSKLLAAIDYIFKNDNIYIYGIYSPYNSSNISDEENDRITRSFYVRNGYTIITKKEFLENPLKYPELSEENFEQSKAKFNYSIVFKKNQKKLNYHFVEEGDTLIEQEILKNEMNYFETLNILDKTATK